MYKQSAKLFAQRSNRVSPITKKSERRINTPGDKPRTQSMINAAIQQDFAKLTQPWWLLNKAY